MAKAKAPKKVAPVYLYEIIRMFDGHVGRTPKPSRRVDEKKFHSPCRFPGCNCRDYQPKKTLIRSAAVAACRCVESGRGLRTQ